MDCGGFWKVPRCPAPTAGAEPSPKEEEEDPQPCPPRDTSVWFTPPIFMFILISSEVS